MDIAELLLTTNRMPTRDAAAAFARAGVPGFPCARDEKRPLTSAGFHDASYDLAQILAWWARWPEANLGVPTGSTSGIDVVDVDAKGVAGSGFPAFKRAVMAGLVDGELARVRTPSGGLHVYFPATRSRPQRCWQAAVARIDFRGTGGYVIAPPSILATNRGRAAYRRFSVSSAHTKPVDAVALREFVDPRRAQPSTRSAPAAPVAAKLEDDMRARIPEGLIERGSLEPRRGTMDSGKTRQRRGSRRTALSARALVVGETS